MAAVMEMPVGRKGRTGSCRDCGTAIWPHSVRCVTCANAAQKGRQFDDAYRQRLREGHRAAAAAMGVTRRRCGNPACDVEFELTSTRKRYCSKRCCMAVSRSGRPAPAPPPPPPEPAAVCAACIHRVDLSGVVTCGLAVARTCNPGVANRSFVPRKAP